MIDLGGMMRGEQIQVAFCVTDEMKPLWPDDAPTLKLFYGDDVIYHEKMAAQPSTGADGVFRNWIFIDDNFPSNGPIHGYIQWKVNGLPYSRPVIGRVIPSGSRDGTVIAVTFVNRPHGRYIVWQTDAGNIYRGSNPRIT